MLCKYKGVEIITGVICVDRVYLSVAIPPKMSISNFMGYLTGKSTLMVNDRHPEIKVNGTKRFGHEDIMWRQLVISPMKQYKNIQKSRQKKHRKKIQEIPLYSGPVKVLAMPPFVANGKKA